MPISDRKIADVLYSLLPQKYRTEDLNAKPVKLPLKRFLQVASVGLEEAEKAIDESAVLFDVMNVPEKFINPLGRMLGFDFPKDMTLSEKRAILDNLPLLYKMKGSTQVFEVIAKIIFGRDSKISVNWTYEEEYTSLSTVIDFYDKNIGDVAKRQEVFKELVQYFRPVNVGLQWSFELKYYDELVGNFKVTFTKDELFIYEFVDEYLSIKTDESFESIQDRYSDDFTGSFEESLYDVIWLALEEEIFNFLYEENEKMIIYMNDNYIAIEESENNNKLNSFILNSNDSRLSVGTGIFLPEFFDIRGITEEEFNEFAEALFLDERVEGTEEIADILDVKDLEQEVVEVSAQDLDWMDYIFLLVDFDEFTEKNFEDIHSDVLNIRSEEVAEIIPEEVNTYAYINEETTDDYTLNVEYESSSTIVDLSSTLNFGKLNSTLLISKNITKEEVNY